MTRMNQCERAAELVSYFYGEANADERRSFEQHLSACPTCREELAGFGEVRTAVRAWHAEVLEHAPTLSLNALVPQATARNGQAAEASFTHAAAPRRTALSALREFFSLTPAWTRFGLVAASLLVCTLAVLAITKAQFSWNDKGIAFGSGWNKQPTQTQAVTAAPAQVATTTTGSSFTQADVDRLIAERDGAQRDLAATRKQLDAAQQQVSLLNASLANSQVTYRQTLAALRTARNVQANGGRARGRFGAQLAEYNPNGVEGDDEGLRLSDLLTEVSAGHAQPQGKRDER